MISGDFGLIPVFTVLKILEILPEPFEIWIISTNIQEY